MRRPCPSSPPLCSPTWLALVISLGAALAACEGPPGRAPSVEAIGSFLANNEAFQEDVRGRDADPVEVAARLLDDPEAVEALAAALAQDEAFKEALTVTLVDDHADTLRGPQGDVGPQGEPGEAGQGFEAIQRRSFVGEDEAARRLTFRKAQATTAARVLYFDHFGLSAQGESGECVWSVRFNGLPCTTPGPLEARLEAGAPSRAALIGGYCEENSSGPLPAGQLELQVEVRAEGDGVTCLTGLPGTAGFMEAYEVATNP